ncbi:type VI secretion system baseplate subunit TssG [Shimia sagamensis]|uniref:Type VI secretion system protein ImpH n=1 Tax=Shimia sagamensis TaxID=1566352 RepID=A0ABY1PKW4_9RHOB|nr:type VI secretion system baseplate subunit TssG [Shimia sagamensis]SMP34736.1 type VI secretion system protein ImpH [Shimia sagamensis]
MADDARQTRADLDVQANRIGRMDFFELLRQLETEAARFGRAGDASKEPARLGQLPRMSFAASDVDAFAPGSETAPPRIDTNVIGLIGPEGPMPLHLTRWIMARMSNRWFAGEGEGASADKAFLDFINMLQHRVIALYWRAWADARADIHVAFGDGGRVTALMRSLAGQGLPGTVSLDHHLEGAKLRHATSLALQARSPERLTAFLETVVGVPVSLEEFTGRWVDIPKHLQSRLGQAHAGLGTAAVMGARFFDRADQAEIRLGPLTQAQFKQFLESSVTWERLHHAVLFAAGRETVFSLRLVLAAGEVPAAQLGNSQLGRTSWLAPESTKGAEDLAFSDLADRPAPANSASRRLAG